MKVFSSCFVLVLLFTSVSLANDKLNVFDLPAPYEAQKVWINQYLIKDGHRFSIYQFHVAVKPPQELNALAQNAVSHYKNIASIDWQKQIPVEQFQSVERLSLLGMKQNSLVSVEVTKTANGIHGQVVVSAPTQQPSLSKLAQAFAKNSQLHSHMIDIVAGKSVTTVEFLSERSLAKQRDWLLQTARSLGFVPRIQQTKEHALTIDMFANGTDLFLSLAHDPQNPRYTRWLAIVAEDI